MGENTRAILFFTGAILMLIFGIIVLGITASTLIGTLGWFWGSLTMVGIGGAMVFTALIILD